MTLQLWVALMCLHNVENTSKVTLIITVGNTAIVRFILLISGIRNSKCFTEKLCTYNKERSFNLKHPSFQHIDTCHRILS